MNALIPYLAALHQQDLLEQAQVYRRRQVSQPARNGLARWRRSLSRLFASAARSLDPSVEVSHTAPLPSGRGASPLPAC
jgi:hypothetical protein